MDSFTGPKLRQADCVKVVVSLEGARVAGRTARFAVEQIHTVQLRFGHGVSALQILVKGALVARNSDPIKADSAVPMSVMCNGPTPMQQNGHDIRECLQRV